MTFFQKLIFPLTYPLSILYGWGVGFRNLLFDLGIKKSQSFDTPTIAVGNLSVGGTGKTPHIEYLVTLLKPHFRIAVISRGYKRKSKGMQVSHAGSTPEQLGDEPFQIWSKNPEITVIAHSNRVEAATYLESQPLPPQVILLDDAFQHRYIKAGLNILLTDYNHPFFNDFILPCGRLRESRKGKNRADLIIVTKTPSSLTPVKAKNTLEKIKATSSQQVFFSALYNPPPKQVENLQEVKLSKDYHIILVTGIARPELIEQKIRQDYQLIDTMHYSDHQNFSDQDIRAIVAKYNSISNPNKAIIVTEKDAVKLKSHPTLPAKVKERLFFLPLEIVFLQELTAQFNKTIISYVTENQRNS